MIRKAAIVITALIGVSFITLFLWMKSTAREPVKDRVNLRFGTMQLDTSKLGIPSPAANGIIVGNDRGELRVFPTFSNKTSPRIIQLSDSAVRAPVLMKDNVCYVGDENGMFWAYDLNDGKKWSYKTGDKISGAAVMCDDLILVGSYDQNFYAFDLRDGSPRHIVKCDDFINGSPVFSKPDNAVFLGSCDGMLRKIDLKTGKVEGKIDLKSPIPASPVLHDGVLYAVSHEGDLVAVDPKSFSTLYRATLSGSYVSSPYVNGNKLFLTDSGCRITVHSSENGAQLSVLEEKERMTPLKAGKGDRFFAVSKRGKLYEYKHVNNKWIRTLLVDFQTDCDQSCQLFGNVLVVADESGGLFFYEVT